MTILIRRSATNLKSDREVSLSLMMVWSSLIWSVLVSTLEMTMMVVRISMVVLITSAHNFTEQEQQFTAHLKFSP